MPSRYDTYGFREASLEEAAELVRRVMGIPLTQGESLYYAGDYYRYALGADRRVKLYRNFDQINNQWIRKDYPGYSVILEVSNLGDMDEIQRKLTAGRRDPVLLDASVLPGEPFDDAELDE